MAEAKTKAGADVGADDSEQARQSAVKQQDPRFTRPPSREPGFETTLVCGYDKDGKPRTFNLLKGEELPEGFGDAPPTGTHPNSPQAR